MMSDGKLPSCAGEDIDVSVQIGGIQMRNPVMTASGTFGYGPEYASLIDLERLGAIVVKGIAAHPTRGNPTARTCETSCGLLNAIGLPNPGVQGFVETYMPFLRQVDVPVIVNIWGKTISEYEDVAHRLDDVQGVHGLEINVSCPNIKEGSALLGTDLDMFKRVIDAVRKRTGLTVIPKLAPNVSDIAAFAKASEDGGADAISLINSIPALAIDIETRRPRLANGTGGLTGPAIKPVALKLVWEASSAVRIPVIGIGGIFTAEDAIEFLIAGASAVAVGTANFINPRATEEIAEGIAGYMIRHAVKRVTDLVGSLEL